MPISKPHSTLGASNKGSCSNLAIYLEKENRDLDKLIDNTKSILEIRNIEIRKQLFFTHNRSNISTNEVIDTIDKNIKKLGSNDTKYFSPTISFSNPELNHILTKAIGNKKIDNIWQLNNIELTKFNNLLQDYVRLIMTNYAQNFRRQNKGLKTGDDLIYFAKIEHFRRYKGTDNEVINGDAKNRDLKPNLNSHAHIIVSRKDKTQRLKLTPTTKERLTDRKIGDNLYRVGFDRIKWINMNERTFDSFFNYKRQELEKFENQNILKNGTPEEKDILLERIHKKEKVNISKTLKNIPKTSYPKSRRNFK